MKQESSAAPPIFLQPGPTIDWLENLNTSRNPTAREGAREDVAEDKVFEWLVWTLITLSLLLVVLGGTVVVHGVLQFDFPMMR